MTDQEIDQIYAESTGQTLREQDKHLAHAFARSLLSRAIPEGHVVVPKEPTKDMVWKAEEDTSHFRHGDPWYGTEPISESQVREVWAAMIAAAAPANKEGT